MSEVQPHSYPVSLEAGFFFCEAFAIMPGMSEKATFALGCFWHPDDYFSKIPGVIKTTAGYTGGTTERPTYELVCGGATGHAEAVEIEFDPANVSYRELIERFFEEHDPTQTNRQGPDIGEQYRSAIFYHSDEQKKIAEEVKKELQASGKITGNIVTNIVPAGPFYSAEEYHQKYLEKRKGFL